MLRRFRSRLTYSNVISTLCLFLLLGGGAYAAFHLPKNSVRSRNIVNGQVKSADVKNNGLTGADIRAATVGGTSRGLVYDSAVTTTLKPLATVRIGSDKWVFKGVCKHNTNLNGTEGDIDVNGPSVSVRLSGEISTNGANPAEPFVTTLPDTTAGTDATIAGQAAQSSQVDRLAGTTWLRKGKELMRVDYYIVADDGAKTCSIHGTVTPAA